MSIQVIPRRALFARPLRKRDRSGLERLRGQPGRARHPPPRRRDWARLAAATTCEARASASCCVLSLDLDLRTLRAASGSPLARQTAAATAPIDGSLWEMP